MSRYHLRHVELWVEQSVFVSAIRLRSRCTCVMVALHDCCSTTAPFFPSDSVHQQSTAVSQAVSHQTNKKTAPRFQRHHTRFKLGSYIDSNFFQATIENLMTLAYQD